VADAPPRPVLAALLLVGALGRPAFAESLQELAFDDADRDVAFLALDLEDGTRWVVAPEELDTPRTPWSTFKIPNLLIALDTGAAESLDHSIDWDPERRPAGAHWPDHWAQRQTLASAFRRSALWFFQDLARAIGGTVYRERLIAFAYGNANAPDGSDIFWLDGTLTISLREQVRFLAALLRDELPVNPKALAALREVARLDERGGHRLYGKTGAGPASPDDFDGPFRGWLVGWVERPERAPVVYALFVDGPDWDSIARFRREAAERLLTDTGAWPPSAGD